MMAMAQLLNIRMPGSHELTFLPPNPDVPGVDGKGAGQSGRGFIFIFIFICVQIKISQQDFRSTGFSLSCVNETDGSFPLSAAPIVSPTLSSSSSSSGGSSKRSQRKAAASSFSSFSSWSSAVFPSRLQQALLHCCHNFNFSKTSCLFTAKEAGFTAIPRHSGLKFAS